MVGACFDSTPSRVIFRISSTVFLKAWGYRRPHFRFKVQIIEIKKHQFYFMLKGCIIKVILP